MGVEAVVHFMNKYLFFVIKIRRELGSSLRKSLHVEKLFEVGSVGASVVLFIYLFFRHYILFLIIPVLKISLNDTFRG